MHRSLLLLIINNKYSPHLSFTPVFISPAPIFPKTWFLRTLLPPLEHLPLPGRLSSWTSVVNIAILLLGLSFGRGLIRGLILASTVNIDIMKVPGFWVLFAVVGTTLICFNFSCSIAGSCFPDLVSTNRDDSTIITATRKLKENRIGMRSNKKDGRGDVTLDDYQPIDPVPSSKASVKPGPIEHGSPLIPYIPRPSPPFPPSAGGSP